VVIDVGQIGLLGVIGWVDHALLPSAKKVSISWSACLLLVSRVQKRPLIMRRKKWKRKNAGMTVHVVSVAELRAIANGPGWGGLCSEKRESDGTTAQGTFPGTGDHPALADFIRGLYFCSLPTPAASDSLLWLFTELDKLHPAGKEPFWKLQWKRVAIRTIRCTFFEKLIFNWKQTREQQKWRHCSGFVPAYTLVRDWEAGSSRVRASS